MHLAESIGLRRLRSHKWTRQTRSRCSTFSAFNWSWKNSVVIPGHYYRQTPPETHLTRGEGLVVSSFLPPSSRGDMELALKVPVIPGKGKQMGKPAPGTWQENHAWERAVQNEISRTQMVYRLISKGTIFLTNILILIRF